MTPLLPRWNMPGCVIVSAKATPMRILVTAGLVDLARGKTRDEIVEMFIHFKETVDKQNRYHPSVRNEFVIATILNPPKFTWFVDNQEPPEPYFKD